MAWSAVGNYGTAENKTSGTTLQIFQPGTAIAAGSVIVVTLAVDNQQATDGDSTLVTSVVGSASGTFTKAKEYTNSDGGADLGITCAVFYQYVGSTISAGVDTITITLGTAKVNKAAAAYIFANTGGQCNVATAQGSVSDVDPASMTISGLTSREYLFVRTVATERGGYGFTPSTNYTAFGVNTTADPGAANSDVQIGSEYRILTGTGDTTDPATGTPASASIYVAFMAASAALTVNVTGVSGTGGIGSASSKVTVRPTATGVAGTSAVGTVSISGKASDILDGVLGVTALGTATVKVNNSTTLTGLAATAAIGTASASQQTTAAVSGVVATSAVGSTTQTGQASLTLTGLSVTATLGTTTPGLPNNAVLDGLSATASLGTATAAAAAGVPVHGAGAAGLLGAAQAFVGTVVSFSAVPVATGAVGAVQTSQTNTRVYLEEHPAPGMGLTLGIIGIRAWGIVNDAAPSTWTNIITE